MCTPGLTGYGIFHFGQHVPSHRPTHTGAAEVAVVQRQWRPGDAFLWAAANVAGLKFESQQIKFMPLAAPDQRTEYMWKIGLPVSKTHSAQRNDEWQMRSLR